MPLIGFGIWKVPAENAADSVYNAIKIGYVSTTRRGFVHRSSYATQF